MERSFLPAIAGFIQRPRIDELIEYSLNFSVVLVTAGPGYGKTLSLAHYMKTANVRLIWLHASTHRTRGADFWEDLVYAAGRELPEYAHQLEELGFPDTPGSFEQFRKITSDVAAEGNRLVLVVDNYERILDKGAILFLDSLIESDIRNLSLFLLCRTALPLAGELPATGIFMITDKDLSFNIDETMEMLMQYGKEVPDVLIEKMHKATGGWPLGLRIVCKLNARNPEMFASGTLVQIAADLHEQHYFKQYPRNIQEKLILFALLPQFSLDMLWDREQEDYTDLHNLLMQHPFVSYDYATGLFLYQTMYHTFLRHKQTLVNPELRRKIQDYAGRWFLDHDMINEAMDCYWEAADYDGFMESISRLPIIHKRISITNRILRRLEQIPENYAKTHPEVDYCIALMHLNAAEIGKAKKLLLDVEKRVGEQSDSDEKKLLLGDIYAVLADISVYQNDDTGLGWMKKAYSLIPQGSRVHSPDVYSVNNNSVFFLPRHKAGQLEYMVGYFMEMAKYADEVKNGCGFGYEYLFAGEAAYFLENMNEAKVMFNSAIIKAQQTHQHDIVCNAMLELARIEVYYGNHKKLLEQLQEIETYIEKVNAVGLYELRDCATAITYIWLGDLEKVPAWFGETISAPEEMPIFLGRKQLTSAYYLYLSGETAKGYALLLQLEAQLKHRGRWSEKLYLYVLMARYHMAAGGDAFIRIFKKVYDMVYHNNIKIALSMHGKQMIAMIDRLKKCDTDEFDMNWLDEVYRDAMSYAKRMQMMRRAYRGTAYNETSSSLTLTARENETLRYLAQGLTQQEMAKLMGISINAVKKHVSKIYYKLGAVNRADAIHIASINGIVDVLND